MKPAEKPEKIVYGQRDSMRAEYGAIGKARQDATDHYSEVAQQWVRRFDIRSIHHRKDLSGRAFTSSRRISVPWPATTRKRLYIIAHEIGHIALHHNSRYPRYVEEFEAEAFAHALLREYDIAVPRDITNHAKCYVAHKISQAHRRGAYWIDPGIAAWASVDVRGINFAPAHGRYKTARVKAKKRASTLQAAIERVQQALTPHKRS